MKDDKMEKFVSGLQLSERLYSESVAYILKEHFPHAQYAAALIGWGSDVLGYDDIVSTDHNWGPRLQLFLSESDYEHYRRDILKILDEHMPAIVGDQMTHFNIHIPVHQRTIKKKTHASPKLDSINGRFSHFVSEVRACFLKVRREKALSVFNVSFYRFSGSREKSRKTRINLAMCF